MSADHHESPATNNLTAASEPDGWEVDDMTDLKQQLNEAVFLGRFMGAISSTLEPADICSIASRWLYDYIPYLRIIFSLSANLPGEPLIYSPGIPRDTCIDPTFPEKVPQAIPEMLRTATNLSIICDERGEILFRRHFVNLRDNLGYFIIYFDGAGSTSFSSSFLSSLKDNISYALKNALEHSKLKEMAMRDSLTGLYNRRVFDEMIEIESSRQELLPLSLLLVDLDDFKRINDRFGHQAGDQVLSRFGRILRDNFRGSDIVARYGGEEFAVMLPGTTSSIAFETARRLRSRLAQTTFVFNGENLKLTASIGISYASDNARSAADLIQRADQALYRAKKSGKNRTCVYAPKAIHIVKKPSPRKPAPSLYRQPEFQLRD